MLVAEAEAAAAAAASVDGPAGSETVGDWLDIWWEAKKPSLSPTTVSSWKSSIQLYLKPRLGSMDLCDVRAHHLEAMYRDLVEGGLSPARVQKVHTVASVAFRAAVRRQLIAASPAADASPPAVGRQEPVAPTLDEVRAILGAVADDLELRAFLLMAANTGARRGEVCALRWCDVDLEARVATLARAVAKGAGTGAVVRQTKTAATGRIAISDQVVSALQELRALHSAEAAAVGHLLASDAFIWSQDPAGERPIYPDTISARFAKVRDGLGLGHVQLRHLRHFAATQLLVAGVDVRTVAGRLRHARPAMTLDRYAAWVPARDRDAADVLGDLGG
ncbi:MAG: tyrosine-type recombinase/integrase [Acidimicrobiales bacterium]